MSCERQGVLAPAPPGNGVTLLVVVKQPARTRVSGWVLQTPPVAPSLLSPWSRQGAEREGFLKELA